MTAIALAGTLHAQEVIQSEKSAYRDSLNRYYIQTEQPLYLYLSTKPNDTNPTPIPNSNSHTKKNEPEPMYLDGNGVHTIHHYDAICHQRVIFYVHADGTAPVTRSIFNGTVSTVKNYTYYGKDISVALLAKDDMSGVAKTFYSMNGAPYKEYTGSIETQKGTNTLKYYSTDHVGNMEKPVEKTFTVDNQAPVSYHTIMGISLSGNIVSPLSVIYLEATDDVSGVAQTFYRFDDGNELLYNGKNIPFGQLAEGEHTLYYYSADKVNNRENPRSITFFFDKSGPIVATDILGDKFIVNDLVYFSGRTKMKLTAVDNKTGIKETKYSINGNAFVTYTTPFYLPSKPGIHVIRYYAVDSLGNSTSPHKNGDPVGNNGNETMEYKHIINKIYVDLTGPSLAYKYKGPVFTARDTVFISSTTEIIISGHDNESGLQKLMYTLDKNPTEIPYQNHLTIPTSGKHNMEIIGYDNVNNRNIKSLVFVVDNEPPDIQNVFSVDPIGTENEVPVCPPYVQLFVAPTDNLTGISKINYSVNKQPVKEYLKFIDGFQEEQSYEVKIIVSDKLDNVSEKTVRFNVKNK
ncbi:MAG: hypothetical protein LBF89_06225 [Bacteroidales bacterium]|jgi:hypothetical protein|nr:hypothetical protein [Bacteroidales bacterium]